MRWDAQECLRFLHGRFDDEIPRGPSGWSVRLWWGGVRFSRRYVVKTRITRNRKEVRDNGTKTLTYFSRYFLLLHMYGRLTVVLLSVNILSCDTSMANERIHEWIAAQCAT